MHAHLFEQTSSQNSKAASSFLNQKRCLDKLFVHHASRTNHIRRLGNCTALAKRLRFVASCYAARCLTERLWQTEAFRVVFFPVLSMWKCHLILIKPAVSTASFYQQLLFTTCQLLEVASWFRHNTTSCTSCPLESRLVVESRPIRNAVCWMLARQMSWETKAERLCCHARLQWFTTNYKPLLMTWAVRSGSREQ